MTEDLRGDPFDIDVRMAEARCIAAVIAIRTLLANLEETIQTIHALTVAAPQDEGWDKVRDAVSSLVSVVDVMHQSLDSIAQSQQG